MSKRLQVLLPDEEMNEIRRLAAAEQLTVGEWVRRSLRQAREQEPARIAAKLRAIHEAAQYSFPVGDIRQMIDEIEQGYLG